MQYFYGAAFRDFLLAHILFSSFVNYFFQETQRKTGMRVVKEALENDLILRIYVLIMKV